MPKTGPRVTMEEWDFFSLVSQIILSFMLFWQDDEACLREKFRMLTFDNH